MGSWLNDNQKHVKKQSLYQGKERINLHLQQKIKGSSLLEPFFTSRGVVFRTRSYLIDLELRLQ